jgi:hypothetical protein
MKYIIFPTLFDWKTAAAPSICRAFNLLPRQFIGGFMSFEEDLCRD